MLDLSLIIQHKNFLYNEYGKTTLVNPWKDYSR